MFLEKYAKLKSSVDDNDTEFTVNVYDDELETNKAIMWLHGYVVDRDVAKSRLNPDVVTYMQEQDLYEIIHVEIVNFDDNLYFNLPQNKQDACATVLFKRFLKFYRDYFEDVPVRAEFENYDLQEKFKAAVDRGFFPEESLELSGYTSQAKYDNNENYNKQNRENQWKLKQAIPEYIINQGIQLEDNTWIIDTPVSQTENAINTVVEQLNNDFGSSLTKTNTLYVKYDNGFKYTIPISEQKMPYFDYTYSLNDRNFQASMGGGVIRNNEEDFRRIFDTAETIFTTVVDGNGGMQNIDDFFASNSEINASTKVKRLKKGNR